MVSSMATNMAFPPMGLEAQIDRLAAPVLVPNAGHDALLKITTLAALPDDAQRRVLLFLGGTGASWERVDPQAVASLLTGYGAETSSPWCRLLAWSSLQRRGGGLGDDG